jgi:hypothetical protein
VSVGQVAFLPVQYSAKSHRSSRDGLHIVPLFANWQVEEQHAEFVGSQTAPVRNLHARYQHTRKAEEEERERKRGTMGKEGGAYWMDRNMLKYC